MLAKTFFDLVFLLTICTENPIKHQASELTKGLFSFAESGQFPFLVKLRPGNDTYYNFECDGALISPEYVVTAASCLDDNYELIRINFGALNLRRPSFTVDAKEVILHPNFDKSNTLYDYDIGLIKLPFKLDEREISPILLQSPYYGEDETWFDDYVNQGALIMGYSNPSDERSEEVADALKFAKIQIISNKQCGRSYSDPIGSTKMCATDFKDGYQVCLPYRGSPLVTLNNRGQHILIGISSFAQSFTCPHAGPIGFERISTSLEFIKSVIDN